MHIAFITMNRWVEDRAAVDEEFAARIRRNGKVLLRDGRGLSDDALVAQLRAAKISMNRESFLQLARRYFSAEDMATAFYDDPALEMSDRDQDWVWIALTCLWERWSPDRPSLEMIDDRIQDGYKAVKEHHPVEACRLWLAAWNYVSTVMTSLQMHTLEEYDQRFSGTYSVSQWVSDFVPELLNASLRDESFLRQRLAVLEAVVQQHSCSKFELEGWTQGIAETLFALGQTERGEAIFRRLIEDSPGSAWNWIRWSDCYRIGREEDRDLVKAEEILQRGLAGPGVDPRADLHKRLAHLYESTGRPQEAQALRARSTEPEKQRIQPGAATMKMRADPGKHVPLLKTPPRNTPVETSGAKTGRNAPCPCGSGKKFKKCCGKTL